MKTIFFIARRYLFSKKSHNVINLISGITMVGIGIATAALVIILSAFNGLDNLIQSMYSSFDPAIKITSEKGKVIALTPAQVSKIKGLAGVENYCEVLEEQVLIKYKDRQALATLKGVSNEFLQMTKLDNTIAEGSLKLEEKGLPMAVLGYGIGYRLSLFIQDNFTPLHIYAARRGKTSSMNPESAFKQKMIMPSALFSINQDFDEKYAVVPISFARELFERPDSVLNAVELGLAESADPDEVKNEIISLLGPGFKVKTRAELDEMIFKTTQTEKKISFILLAFILIITAFNIIGSLTVLIIEKKQDIKTMKSLGASKSMISMIFITEGTLISVVGGLAGIVLGCLLVWIQSSFGIVRLNSALVDFYPVAFEFADLINIAITVIVIGLTCAWIPAKVAVRKHYD